MILNENAENFNTYDFINASFPIMHLLGRGLDLTPSFFGVQTYDPSEMKNSTTTNIKDLKVIVLQFRAQQPPQWTSDDKISWERSVGNFYRTKVILFYLNLKWENNSEQK